MPVNTVTVSQPSVRHRVGQRLRRMCQELGRNAALPSVRDLARQLEVNHLTVLRSLRELEQEGHVSIVPRKGTFVRAVPAPGVRVLCMRPDSVQSSLVFERILSGLQEAAGDGLDVGAISVRPESLPEAPVFADRLIGQDVESIGVVGFGYLQGAAADHETQFLLALSEKLHVVLLGKPHASLSMDCVYYDIRPQLREVMGHHLERGVKRFGYLGAWAQGVHHRERFDAFREFLLDHGLGWDRAAVPESPAAAKAWLTALPRENDGPQLVFASMPNLAEQLVVEGLRKGIDIGRSLRVATYSGARGSIAAIAPYVDIILGPERKIGQAAQVLLGRRRVADRVSDQHETISLNASILYAGGSEEASS